MDTIKVWVENINDGALTKSALPPLARTAVKNTIELSGEALRESIKSFASQFITLFDGGVIEGSTVVIDEIELSLTVSASGGIELVGKLSVGAEAAIKIKLKRPQ
jgi:hypothetical protein